jgi:hypothetical protein
MHGSNDDISWSFSQKFKNRDMVLDSAIFAWYKWVILIRLFGTDGV